MNDSFWTKYIFRQSINENIFTDSSGKESMSDFQNRHLYPKMMGIYLNQQVATGNMYPEFQADVKRINYYSNMMYVYSGIGALFALTVWNPNFIRRRAWYMKKISLGIWTLIGWQYGRKWWNDEMTFTMLKAYDYLPLEAKRAI